MSYLSRNQIVPDGAYLHITYKCHNDSWYLKNDVTKNFILYLVKCYRILYGLTFYSYCIMDNHVHFVCHCETQDKLSNFFRTINSRLSKHINKLFLKKGQSIMDRYKSPVVQSDEHLFSVIIYNILNPTRTKKHIHPKNYKYSSYHFFAYGEESFLKEPQWYTDLGDTPEKRQRKFRQLINQIIVNDPKLMPCPYKNKKGKFHLLIGNEKWIEETIIPIKQAAKQQRQRWINNFRETLAQAGLTPISYRILLACSKN